MGLFYYCEVCHWIYPEAHVEQIDGEHSCFKCGSMTLVELSPSEAREAFLAATAAIDTREAADAD